MNYTLIPVFGVSLFLIFFAFAAQHSFADSTRLNDEFVLEKTIVTMNIPQDNVLPWGTVRGTIDDPAQGYPVIIQFFDEYGEEPIHIAQVDVKEDDTYEYKFRVRDVNLETGTTTNIFEGNYLVKIFKVINSPLENINSI